MDALVLDPWSITRVLKFLGLALYSVGVSGIVVANDRIVRLRALYGLLVPGFVLTYASGWMLMRLSGRGLLTPWLIAGVIAGWLSLHLAFLCAYRTRPRPVTPILAWGFLGAAISVMSMRVQTVGLVISVALFGLVAGCIASWPFARFTAASGRGDEAAAWRGLRWLIFLETTSLLLLVGVAMPLRNLAGVHLDGGTGLLGWVHGTFVLLFLQSLALSCSLFDWPRRELVAGAVSAVIPGAGFWLHRRLRSKLEAR